MLDMRASRAGEPSLRVRFSEPSRVLQAHDLTEVANVIDAAHGHAMSGAWCVGYVRYEAARAFERGCHSAWVETFSFQAPGFYRKLGYEPFGELDYPPGHKRIFLHKRLAGGA